MAKMGSRKHLKRYKAPKSWPIHPKEDTWTVKPSAGSHSIENAIPLTLVIRDVLSSPMPSASATFAFPFLLTAAARPCSLLSRTSCSV